MTLGTLVPQLFPMITDTVPETVPHFNWIESVFWPDIMTAPWGTVQEYEFAPGTELTE
jgi:hypothetical protein